MCPISKKIVNIRAEISCDNFSCDGYIENLSEDNICCSTTAKNLSPGTEFQVTFKQESGEALNLNCRLKWSYELPPHNIINSIGMDILNQPAQYKSFLKSLS
ncbi:MAG: PilZ domain-containing protein [Nitrospiraceae bacterium]|nr:MAG: PilZ domain-containing protein [Nitrospiraceae bacterium]